MIAALIGIAFVLAIAIGFSTRIGNHSKRWEDSIKQDIEEQELYLIDGKVTSDAPQYAFVFVKYRGFVFSMRINEKADIWDKMTRRQRNEQLEAMKKAVKRGEIIEDKFDDNTVCYVPRKGDLKKIRDDYNTFISLGGKIEDDGN